MVTKQIIHQEPSRAGESIKGASEEHQRSIRGASEETPPGLALSPFSVALLVARAGAGLAPAARRLLLGAIPLSLREDVLLGCPFPVLLHQTPPGSAFQIRVRHSTEKTRADEEWGKKRV